MAERIVEGATATGKPTRALGAGLASAFRGRGLMIFLAGAALMAAAGAWAGSQVGLDQTEIRVLRGPHLRVLPGQGGKTSVTIP